MNVNSLTTSTLGNLNAWLKENPHFVALDTETTGLDPWAPDFRCTHIALGAPDGSGWLIDPEQVDLARDGLRLLAGHRVWAHNAHFDRGVLLRALGVDLPLADSLTLAKVARPRPSQDGFGLKDLRPATQAAQDELRCAWAEAGGDPTAADWLAQACANLHSHPAMHDYVVTDAVETARLVWELAPEARTFSGWQLEIDTERWWSAASDRGLLVDIDALDREIERLAETRERAIQVLGLDVTRNTKETRQWLATRGIEIRDRDDKPTLSNDFFKTATVPDGSREAWKAFIAAREVAANANTLKAMGDHLEPDRRIHGVIRTMGTATGRMASMHPNLQNIPAAMRHILIADPGHVLLGADFSSVEPRLAALMSGDHALRNAVVAGDPYEAMAISIWGPDARGDKRRRSQAKVALLATLYGQGVSSLAASLGVDESAAAQVRTDFRATFGTLSRWSSQRNAQAKAGQWQSTYFGRSLPRPIDADAGEPRPYRATNWAVQGSAADLFKQATARVIEHAGADCLWLPIHDELIIQVPEDGIEDGLEALDQMATDIDGVPFPAKPEVLGTAWRKA